MQTEQIKISYNDNKLRLLPNNPRYTLASKIDILNIEFEKYEKSEIIETLLKHEGDWENLYELIEQLELGYNSALDQIFLITGKDDFYYVIEGNRRIMVMNLINDFEKYKDVLSKFKNTKNFKKVFEKLEKNQGTGKFDELDVVLLKTLENNDENEIWKIIYARHAGENKGKRNWPRLKYLYDLRDAFLYDKKTKEINEKYENISSRFNKPISSIKNDVKSSLWITDLIDTYNQNKNDDEKVIETENNDYTSALELSRSNIRIDYKYETKNLNDLFDIEIDINNWKVEIKGIEKQELYDFLVSSAKNKKFTTRGWNEEIEYLLYEFFNKYLDDNYENNSTTIMGEIKRAEEIDENKRTKMQKEYIKYRDNISKLKNIQKKLNEIKDEEIDDAIKIGLKKMWENNSGPLINLNKKTPKNYPFLISSILIRSTLELLCFFAVSQSEKLLDKIIQKWNNLDPEKKEEWKKTSWLFEKLFKSNKKEFIKESIYNKQKTDGVFAFVKKLISENYIDIEDILESITKGKKDQKSRKIEIDAPYISGMIKGQNLKVPNKIIHTYHYLNDSDNFDSAFQSLNRQFEILNSMLENWLLIKKNRK
ncbi:hypothetical protein [Metamycoplasma alkalescens]|uniref:hypothetical protein n=1 Tax=Metamycoplasma alkalescens TaxID=45363 RepID=UPI003D04C982